MTTPKVIDCFIVDDEKHPLQQFKESIAHLPANEQYLEIDKLAFVWKLDWDTYFAYCVAQGLDSEVIQRRKFEYFSNCRRLIWEAFEYESWAL